MKNFIIGVAVMGIAVLTFGAVGYVYAQAQTPPEPDYPYSHGMMGGFGGYGHNMMGFGHGWMGGYDQEGPMHSAMVAALADALGLTPEEIESRHEAGETHWEIAAAGGLSPEETREVMISAHDSAMEEAIADGSLTPEQAEWMQEHMEWMWNNQGEYEGHGGHCGGGWFNNNAGQRGMGW